MLKILGRLPFVPFLAALFGTVVLILLMAMPAWQLKELGAAAGLGSLLADVSSPLDFKAHVLVAGIGAVCVSLFLFLLGQGVRRIFGRTRRPVCVRAWAKAPDLAMPGEAAPPAVDRKDDKVVDMARMPRFLRREKAGRADEELLLDIAAPEAAAPAMAPPNPPGRPQLVLVSDVRTEEVSPSRPPSVYLPQPDPVFLHAPPPVPPPGADPARLASERLTAPGVADLIDRLERALAQTRDEAHPSAEQAALKAAIVQLDALMTAAGR